VRASLARIGSYSMRSAEDDGSATSIGPLSDRGRKPLYSDLFDVFSRKAASTSPNRTRCRHTALSHEEHHLGVVESRVAQMQWLMKVEELDQTEQTQDAQMAWLMQIERDDTYSHMGRLYGELLHQPISPKGNLADRSHRQDRNFL